jgi:hypothetical protein
MVAAYAILKRSAATANYAGGAPVRSSSPSDHRVYGEILAGEHHDLNIGVSMPLASPIRLPVARF